jgi:hypothetical protein
MSTKFISSSLVLLSVIFSGCNKVPQVEVQKAPESKAIVIKTDKDLAKSVHIKIEGREIKSYIQELIATCVKTRNIDLNQASIEFTAKSLQASEVDCNGAYSTGSDGRGYVNLSQALSPDKIKLSFDNPLLNYKIPKDKTAVFLAEGYQLGKSKRVGKNQIGVLLVDSKR